MRKYTIAIAFFLGASMASFLIYEEYKIYVKESVPLSFLEVECIPLQNFLEGTYKTDGEWILVNSPPTSNITQADIQGSNPCFDPDVCGDYELTYRTTGNCIGCDPVDVTITIPVPIFLELTGTCEET